MVDVRLMSSSENTEAPWRVGVLFSQTGVTCAVEQSQLNATLLAIEEINSGGGVLGRMVEPVIYDPQSDPRQFRSLAERLFQLDGIKLRLLHVEHPQGGFAGGRKPPRPAVLSDPL
jgi:branched-chain amino acid transport system substrate-binding protein